MEDTEGHGMTSNKDAVRTFEEQAGEAEIDDFHIQIAIQKQVFHLEVPVDDVFALLVLNSWNDLT